MINIDAQSCPICMCILPDVPLLHSKTCKKCEWGIYFTNKYVIELKMKTTDVYIKNSLIDRMLSAKWFMIDVNPIITINSILDVSDLESIESKIDKLIIFT